MFDTDPKDDLLAERGWRRTIAGAYVPLAPAAMRRLAAKLREHADTLRSPTRAKKYRRRANQWEVWATEQEARHA